MRMSLKSSISFGMVYIPVKLEVAADEKDISFNQLEKNTMSRVRYQKTCDSCGGKIVDNKDIVKAYQYEKDKYVVLDDEDFEKIKSKKDKSITIEQFADLSEIDPVFYDKPYYVVPTGAFKAYCLLKEAMEESGRVAIAKAVIGQKEKLIALRVNNDSLLLSTLYFKSQIRQNPVAKIDEALSAQEREIASLIIKNMTKPLDMGEYKDEYSAKVTAAIEAKIEGRQITAPAETGEKLTDLMEALRLSLTASQKQEPRKEEKPPKKKEPPQEEPPKKQKEKQGEKAKKPAKTALNKTAMIAKGQ